MQSAWLATIFMHETFADYRHLHARFTAVFCAGSAVFRFRDVEIDWTAVRFTDFVSFLTAEFERLPNRDTIKTLLAVSKLIDPSGTEPAFLRWGSATG